MTHFEQLYFSQALIFGMKQGSLFWWYSFYQENAEKKQLNRGFIVTSVASPFLIIS